MLSPYRIQPNNANKRTKKLSNTNFDNNSHLKHNLKRPEITSNDLKRPQLISESALEVKLSKNKIKLKGSGNIEFNDEDLDETLHNKII